MKNAVICGSGSYTPENRVSNNDLSKIMDTNDEWIYTRTGIKNRHISTGENTSDIACKAGEIAIQDAGFKPDDIDLIIVSTITPDRQMPSVACMVQKKLGAINAAAFDLSAACSGFIYALDVADSMIKSGRFKRILVIGAEILSKSVDWNDRTTAVLFGDGAGAVVLGASEEKGIISSYLAAEGDKGEYLMMEDKPVINPYSKNNSNYSKFITMDGRQVFKFSTRVIVAAINEVLKKSRDTLNDISWIIPHQANGRIISFAADKLGIAKEKFYLNIEEYGNTSSASIAIALDEALKEKKIKKGEKIVLVGFGGGLTYGAMLLQI